MKLVVIIGPQAVGKMTVGQELQKITGLKLFHNHMTIDLVRNFFPYSSEEGRRLVRVFRKEIFEAVAQSDLYGMIFTYVCDFNDSEDWDYLRNLYDSFMQRGAELYFVELEAEMDVRLERNKTPNRLLHKPSKRDLAFTEADILTSTEKYRLNSKPGEIAEKHYMRINNTDIEPAVVAEMIKSSFDI